MKNPKQMFQSTFICVMSCSLFHCILFYSFFFSFLLGKALLLTRAPRRPVVVHTVHVKAFFKIWKNVSKGFMKLASCTEANKGIGRVFLLRLLVILEFASEKKKKKKSLLILV